MGTWPLKAVLGCRRGNAVGLSAVDINDMGRLVQLVANPGGTSRDDIYLAVASLYQPRLPIFPNANAG